MSKRLWRWCSTYDGSVCKNLARVYYEVHFDSIKVDNEEDITLEIKKY